eukprot:2811167-Rhodomonas_salina.1
MRDSHVAVCYARATACPVLTEHVPLPGTEGDAPYSVPPLRVALSPTNGSLPAYAPATGCPGLTGRSVVLPGACYS